jgi:hypothetical protein
MHDRERVRKVLASMQTAAELLTSLETPLSLGQVLAHPNADAQLLRGLARKLKAGAILIILSHTNSSQRRALQSVAADLELRSRLSRCAK